MLAAKVCLPFPASLASRQGAGKGGAPAQLMAQVEHVSVSTQERLRMPLSACEAGRVQD